MARKRLARAEKTAPISKPKTVPKTTQAALATALGLKARRVRELIYEHGMPRALEAALPWYVQFKISAEVKRRTPTEKGTGHLKERDLKNRLLELEIAEKEGTHVLASLHRARVREVALKGSGAIRSLRNYAPDIVGLATVADANAALERIENRLLAMARGDDPDTALAAAAP